jgi:hypothetical protein
VSRLDWKLQRAAIIVRDLRALFSGDPVKMARRVKNKWLGRMIGRAMRRIWRWP